MKGDSIDHIFSHPVESEKSVDAERPRVSGVRLRSGAEIPADLVVVGIGAIPVVGPFRGLEQSQGGILVDDHLRACGPGVAEGSCFAVGDVACFPMPLLGRSERVEHVDHARKSAMHVSRALCGGGGGGAPYDYLPYFYSRVFEERGSPRPVRWVFYGDSPATTDVVVLGDFMPQLAAFWVNAESRLVGVFLESGSPEEVEALPRIARTRPTVNAQALRGLGVKEALRLVGATQPPKEE